MNLNDYAKQCRQDNNKWWVDENGNKVIRNKAELLFLIISEVVEAGEGERKQLMDDHLPHRKVVEVELADALIRIFDYAGEHHLDLQQAYEEKREYNRIRSDHNHAERNKPNGKKW